jgi:hypothetical protein
MGAARWSEEAPGEGGNYPKSRRSALVVKEYLLQVANPPRPISLWE